MALTGEAMSPEKRAFGMGVFLSAYFLINAIARPLAGWIYDITNDPFSAVAFGIVLFGLVIVTNVWFQMTQRKADQPFVRATAIESSVYGWPLARRPCAGPRMTAGPAGALPRLSYGIAPSLHSARTWHTTRPGRAMLSVPRSRSPVRRRALRVSSPPRIRTLDCRRRVGMEARFKHVVGSPAVARR